MRIFLAIILSFLINTESNFILWDSTKKLEWEDFQGKLPTNKGIKIAVSSVKINIKRQPYYEGDTPTYVVKSFFDKKKSWTTTNSEKSLSHERLHFDITEVYSRKIRCQLKVLKEADEKDINVYKSTYRQLLKEHSEIQDKYDNEVYFSEVKQQEWIDNIHKELEELKDYGYVPEE